MLRAKEGILADSPPVLPGSRSSREEDLHQAWAGSLTCPGTAAGLRTAGTADVTAAAVRAALAPADPHQEEEQERPQDHQAHKDPLWKKKGRKGDTYRTAHCCGKERQQHPPSGEHGDKTHR